MALSRLAILTVRTERSSLKPPADWSDRKAAVVAKLAHLGLYARRLVCVHPAAGNETKQWPPGHFANMFNLLTAAEDIDVALIGGPDETAIADAIIKDVAKPDRLHNLIGKLKLEELPQFLATCALFVGNDSGPKHIAAAVGVPTIGIHSGVVDARQWAPMGASAVAFNAT